MSLLLTAAAMADKKVAYQIRLDREWLDLVGKAAEKLGLNVASYIRLATNERLQKDGFEQVKRPPKRKA